MYQRDAEHTPWRRSALRPTGNSPSRRHCDPKVLRVLPTLWYSQCSTPRTACQEENEKAPRERGALPVLGLSAVLVLVVLLVLLLILLLVVLLILLLIFLLVLLVVLLLILLMAVLVAVLFTRFHGFISLTLNYDLVASVSMYAPAGLHAGGQKRCLISRIALLSHPESAILLIGFVIAKMKMTLEVPHAGYHRN